MLMIFILTISFHNVAKAEGVCEGHDYRVFGYVHPQRGKVVVYTPTKQHQPLPEDLVCAAIKQFWGHKDSFPNKLTIMVARFDYRSALIMQINLKTNTLLLTTINLPPGKIKVKTIWTMFSDPMARLTEMIRNEELPITSKHSTKANYIYVSWKDLVYLATGYTDQGSIIISNPVPKNDRHR